MRTAQISHDGIGTASILLGRPMVKTNIESGHKSKFSRVTDYKITEQPMDALQCLLGVIIHARRFINVHQPFLSTCEIHLLASPIKKTRAKEWL